MPYAMMLLHSWKRVDAKPSILCQSRAVSQFLLMVFCLLSMVVCECQAILVCLSNAICYDERELPRLFLNGEDAEAQHLAVTQAFHTGLERLSLGSQSSATAVRSAKKVRHRTPSLPSLPSPRPGFGSLTSCAWLC